MSSIIDSRRDERGQTLAIFAFGLIGILAVAALVFDVGQNLFDRRKQQDVADSAALAAARWLTTTNCKAAPSVANCPGSCDGSSQSSGVTRTTARRSFRSRRMTTVALSVGSDMMEAL